ncbi:MAG TPA: DNA cytosine methyltransferase [Armatimonadota bacterium]|jgi:DNA (cytosine-5)-methyltransferase 1
MPLKYYEFFAGCGLVRQGLRADWRCIWANDIEPKKAEVYALNFGRDGQLPDDFHLGDVANVSAADLPPGADMAWASFPCQDLSLAGWRRGVTARRSGTFWAFWRIMRDLYDTGDRPPVIVIENVAGLLYGDNLLGLAEALAALGMQFGPLLIDARRFVAQSRPRVFVVAVDADVDCTEFLEPSPKERPWFTKPILDAEAALPACLAPLWRYWHLPIPSQAPTPLSEIIRDSPSGVPWHTHQETLRLLGLMTECNRAKVRRAQDAGGRAVGLLYKRTRQGRQRAEVRFDGVAGCLRTPGGGSSRQTVVIVNEGTVRSRLLAPSEAAALMGASEFRLPSGYNDAYRAMGDGVVAPVVSWLSEHLLAPLASASLAASEGIRGGPDALQRPHMASNRKTAERRAAQWKALHR